MTATPFDSACAAQLMGRIGGPSKDAEWLWSMADKETQEAERRGMAAALRELREAWLRGEICAGDTPLDMLDAVLADAPGEGL